MNENLAVQNEEQGKINIVSFLNDLLHRLRNFWWIILLLTVAFGAAETAHDGGAYHIAEELLRRS